MKCRGGESSQGPQSSTNRIPSGVGDVEQRLDVQVSIVCRPGVCETHEYNQNGRSSSTSFPCAQKPCIGPLKPSPPCKKDDMRTLAGVPSTPVSLQSLKQQALSSLGARHPLECTACIASVLCRKCGK